MNEIHKFDTAQHYLDLSLFHRIDINLYPLFVAIFEQKSISRAAQSLSISQSAASHALQRLRVQLEDEVFIRLGNSMQPTPFAEHIYPVIKNALILFQNISQQKKSFDPSLIKTLRVAIHDEIEPLVLPKIIQHFEQIDQNIEFSSIKLNRNTIQNDLLNQQLDFIIDVESPTHDSIGFQALLKDHYVICSQQSVMNAEIYRSGLHIGVSSRRTGTLLEDVYLHRQGIHREIFLRCQHYSTALKILEYNRDAILTLPSAVLSHLSYATNLTIHSIPFELPTFTIGIYWSDALIDNLRYDFLKKEIISLFA